ncbi:peptidoglycan-associated lipoprotein Pal [Radicibacter daui]|uniref:peptidoglycan-associated lipoprotein Pal n=1 Tax=Radicibacter daui TaxID=3064829 RepID=UPI004046B055
MNVLRLAATLSLVALTTVACAKKPTDAGAMSTSGSTAAAAPATGPVPGSQEDLVVNVGDRVFFAFDKYALDSEAQATLTRQADWMKKYPAVTVTVEGHADERGTREYNLALGEKRANSAKDFLVALGVATSRITVISYGKERPAVLGTGEAVWAQNRRAVTVVSN